MRLFSFMPILTLSSPINSAFVSNLKLTTQPYNTLKLFFSSICSNIFKIKDIIIMGIVTYEYEVVSTISPSRLFKSFILDSDNLIPKVVPGAFKSFEILEGDGGVGTIKLITFGEGKYRYLCSLLSFSGCHI